VYLIIEDCSPSIYCRPAQSSSITHCSSCLSIVLPCNDINVSNAGCKFRLDPNVAARNYRLDDYSARWPYCTDLDLCRIILFKEVDLTFLSQNVLEHVHVHVEKSAADERNRRSY
jgi:hypothetical protein